MRTDYSVFMTRNTIAYVSEYNEVGQLVTDIYTTNGVYRVDMEPIKLIDKVLKNYGSSYRGAKDSSKFHLGDIDMPPLVIGGAEGVYLFPSESPASHKCIWFVLHHVQHHKAIDKKNMAVYLTNGLVLTVEVSNSSFERRLTSATRLRVKMEGRHLNYRSYDIEVDYQMVRELKGYTYRTKRQIE